MKKVHMVNARYFAPGKVPWRTLPGRIHTECSNFYPARFVTDDPGAVTCTHCLRYIARGEWYGGTGNGD